MLRYKFDVLAALKDKGYSSTRIRNEKIMGESYISQIRHGQIVSWDKLNLICCILNCQPGDLLEYVPDKPEYVPDNSEPKGE